MTPARVLFTFAGGLGHLNPLLPLAALLRGRGHLVGVSGRASAIASTSLFEGHTFPEGSASRSDTTVGDLAAPDLEHELAVVGRFFAGTSAVRTAARVTEVIRTWRPDLVVADEMDFGARVAAAAAGIKVVVVSVIASGALTRAEHVGQPLADLRKAHGLPPDPELRMLGGDLLVHPFPPSLRDPGLPLPADALVVRPEDPSGDPRGDASSGLGGWLGAGRPSAYLTLGTIFNAESGDLFGRLIAGAAHVAERGGVGRVLVTVGPDLDPAGFGVQPERVRLERYVEQAQILPHCDVVVCHGGSGSVVAALGHGLPLVVVPMGADQELNAQRVVALGVGVVLDPLTVSVAEVRAAIQTVVAPGSPHRAAAARLKVEIASLPPIASVIPRVEAPLPEPLSGQL